MKTSLIFSLALLAIGSANIKDMYDCRALEVTYPYTFGGHVIIKSDPPIMKCEYRCAADELVERPPWPAAQVSTLWKGPPGPLLKCPL
ncbi:hypothetical protein PRIPAC_96051, partial [Pristionchus pacificus]|uniref:Uncharacterized protein n=1 Tax=Pristionchus pacificus TaxID=54126 RepID=A0A2A6D115_PRIPA